MSDSNPVLPVELERLIFEMAFNSQDQNGTNGNMVLVAKRVRLWLRPFIYRVLHLHHDQKFPSLMTCPKGVDIDEITSMVEHLIIDYSGPFARDIKVVRSLIDRCPNIWNIALWSHNIIDIFDAISTVKNLRRLSANFLDVTKEQMAEPVFAALTHLELLHPCSDWPFEALRSLRYLTHLSYFVMGDRSSESKIPVILSSSFKPLDAMIVCISECHRLSNASSFESMYAYPQLVLFDHSMSHTNDWIKGARGGCDIWCHADNFVFARKQKYFITDDYQKHAISEDFDWMKHLTEEGKQWYLTLHA